MQTVDDYIATVTPAQRMIFEDISSTVKHVVPSVEQGWSYGIAAYMYKGKPLIAFMATKKHLSIYPFSGKVIDKLRNQLNDYNLSPGVIRFSEENPLPESLIKDIIITRLQEIEG